MTGTNRGPSLLPVLPPLLLTLFNGGAKNVRPKLNCTKISSIFFISASPASGLCPPILIPSFDRISRLSSELRIEDSCVLTSEAPKVVLAVSLKFTEVKVGDLEVVTLFEYVTFCVGFGLCRIETGDFLPFVLLPSEHKLFFTNV